MQIAILNAGEKAKAIVPNIQQRLCFRHEPRCRRSQKIDVGFAALRAPHPFLLAGGSLVLGAQLSKVSESESSHPAVV